MAELTLGVKTEEGTWEIYIDGSASQTGSGAGVLVRSLAELRTKHTINFGFTATNNKAKYEALRQEQGLKQCWAQPR